MNGVAVVLPLALLLVAVVTQLAARSVIKRNRLIGIRIPSTLRSDAAWLAGHRAAVGPAWIGFAVATLVGAGDILTGGSIPLTVAVVLVFVASVTFSMYATGRAARNSEASRATRA